MIRIARRMQRHDPRGPAFDPDQHYLEAALRGRTARKVRAHVRRMEPLVLMTPRWSQPQGFLEDLALDLAVGEPGVACRTISFRPLKGRSAQESWSFLLPVLAQLRSVGGRSLPMMVVGRHAFRTAALDLLLRAQDEAREPMALLAHGLEYLPIDTLEDISVVWARFAEQTRSGRRATLLLAGSVDAPALDEVVAKRVSLEDFGEAEAAAAIVGRAGPAPLSNLEGAARFSGGVPAIVEAVGAGSRSHGGVPRSQAGLVRSMGPLADEIRYAVDIVNSDSVLSDRLQQLLRGEPLLEVPSVDRPLQMAGLLRRVRSSGEGRVLLRAPAIGAVIS